MRTRLHPDRRRAGRQSQVVHADQRDRFRTASGPGPRDAQRDRRDRFAGIAAAIT
jgi:hypothetical protein